MEKLISKISALSESRTRVVVAMSGGVDSSLVAAALYAAVGDRALAVTVESELTTEQDGQIARQVASSIGIEHAVLKLRVMANADIQKNGVDRCYHCKKMIFRNIIEEFHADLLLDGTNIDDDPARPGLRAVDELGVISPLKSTGMTKAMIREQARIIGLPNWDTPSESCLATRIKQGNPLTKAGLEKVRLMEAFFHENGVPALRISHDNLMASVEYFTQYADIMDENRDNFAALVEKIGLLSFEYKEIGE